MRGRLRQLLLAEGATLAPKIGMNQSRRFHGLASGQGLLNRIAGAIANTADLILHITAQKGLLEEVFNLLRKIESADRRD